MGFDDTFNVYRALFLKSCSFQIRQVKSNVFQIVLVGLLMGVMIALYLAIPSDNGDSYNNGGPTYYDNSYSEFSSHFYPVVRWQQYMEIYWNLFLYYDPNNVAEDLINDAQFGRYYIETTYVSINTTSPQIARVNSESYIYANYSEMQKQLDNNYNNYSLVFQTPTAGIVFDDASDKKLKYTVEASSWSWGSTPWESISPYHDGEMTLYVENWLINAYLRQYTGLNYTLNVTTMAFPYYSYNSWFDISGLIGLIGIFFIPTTLIFILPVFVYSIVSEKQDRLVEMMKIMGIHMPTYWMSNYVFSYMVYLLLAFIVIIMGCAGKLPFFLDVPAGTWILLFLLYGFAQVSFAFFLSCFFNKAKTSVLVCYFVVMLFSGIGSTLQMIVFTWRPAPWILMLFPVFVLQRGAYLITYVTVGPHPVNLISLSTYSPFAECLVYLFLEAPVYMLLAWYLDHVMPRENGVRYSPLFPIHAARSWLRERSQDKSDEKKAILERVDGEPDEFVDDVVQMDFEDEDCQKERKRAHTSSEFLIKIVDLHKTYAGRAGQPAKDALVKFCLALEEGECLGLLGPNGAGKTTLISILCGLAEPSTGTAYVSGFNITTEMYKVHQILGYCPQHDILWQDLTVEEHLLFYCRLKGYNKSNEYSHVNKIANDVGLGGEHLSKKVSELSGGMKRRLSISIALVGESRLVLLDEPTTGLDPDTRRHVWDIINAHKANRSIIITTHNIDEADVLCSKIAIMSLGRLKCIGTALYLKNKFGAGYKVSAHLQPGFEDNYKQWITSMFRQAELDPAAGTSIDYIIPVADLNVSDLFSTMKRSKEQYGILEWAVNQMSLEEVFLKMVATDESQF